MSEFFSELLLGIARHTEAHCTGYRLWSRQPIKYVLFDFAKRTGSFGPIGRSTGVFQNERGEAEFAIQIVKDAKGMTFTPSKRSVAIALPYFMSLREVNGR